MDEKKNLENSESNAQRESYRRYYDLICSVLDYKLFNQAWQNEKYEDESKSFQQYLNEQNSSIAFVELNN